MRITTSCCGLWYSPHHLRYVSSRVAPPSETRSTVEEPGCPRVAHTHEIPRSNRGGATKLHDTGVRVGNRKQAWHKGAHQATSARLRTQWAANPGTRCLGKCVCHALHVDQCTCGQACGKLLTEHPPTAKQPAKWSAGHAYNGGPPIYRPEVIACGSSAGASYGNTKRAEPHSRRW